MPYFTPIHIDVLKELINIGVGKGSETLNKMFQSSVKFNIPEIKLCNIKQINQYIQKDGQSNIVSVNLHFKSVVSGHITLILLKEDAKRIISLLHKTNSDSLPAQEVLFDIIGEFGNIFLNVIIGSISNLIHLHFMYSVPFVKKEIKFEVYPEQIDNPDALSLLSHTNLFIDKHKIDMDIAINFSSDSLSDLIMLLENYLEEKGVHV